MTRLVTISQLMANFKNRKIMVELFFHSVSLFCYFFVGNFFMKTITQLVIGGKPLKRLLNTKKTPKVIRMTKEIKVNQVEKV